ncbi:MAG: TolC family protein [Terriglobales bacterium]
MGDLWHPILSAIRHSSLPIVGALFLLLCLPAGYAAAQAFPANAAVPMAPSSSSMDIGGALQQAQNPVLGSVPTGQASAEVIPLGALEAIDRGLKYNLSLLFSEQATQAARGARWKALSDMLPNLTTRTSETVQQLNLAAFGLSVPGIPSIVGPFSVFESRALLTAVPLDFHALNLIRARTEDVQSAQLNYQNARDIIVLVVGGTYLQALAGQARIVTIEAEFNTAQALFRQAQDMKNAGMAPGIDVLRSQVEMQVQQQRLLAARNDFAKQKLTLARIIGLPVAQDFTLTEKIPVTPPPPLTLEIALRRAYQDRSDYRSAQAQVRSAELNRKAMIGEALPSLHVSGDYGLEGRRPTQSHGVFTAAAALQVPIFQGGKVRGDVMQADALLRQRQAALDDLRGRIEFEIRTAFLDLASAADQVQVAQSSVSLAEQALTQSRDRFRAGVANTVEVVQAQEAMAATNENYINSTFAYNVAKLELARSLGTAERAVKDFLGGKR